MIPHVAFSSSVRKNTYCRTSGFYHTFQRYRKGPTRMPSGRYGRGRTKDKGRLGRGITTALGLGLAVSAAVIAPRLGMAQRVDSSQNQQPLKNSAPQTGPLAGLSRPVPRHIATPKDIPPHFCSTAERHQWYVQNFADEWLEAAENAEDAFHYRAQVSARAAEHANKDGPAAQQEILDAEEAWADKNAMNHLKARQDADRTRARILGTSVIDCSAKSLAALVAQQKGRIANIDAQIEATQTKIKAIGKSIADTLTEYDLVDAYEHGVLWGVEPTTVEHHNVLRSISDAQGEQSSLKRGLDQLVKRKAELQNQLNNTTKFAESVTNAGAPCPEPARTASLSLNATPVEKPHPAQAQTPASPDSPLTPEQIKLLQETGRDWGAADYHAEQIADAAPPRDVMQYRLKARFDSFVTNHALSEQERKSFADGYWRAYEDLSSRDDLRKVETPVFELKTAAASPVSLSRASITDPVWHLRRLADAWVNSGNRYLQRQGESLAAQLDEIEKSRQGAKTQAAENSGSKPFSAGAGSWYRVEGQISGISLAGQSRVFRIGGIAPSLLWNSDDEPAPEEGSIDGNGNLNIHIWSPKDFLKGPANVPAGSGRETRSSADRIEMQMGDERWKAALMSPLRVSLRNLGQGDSTILGWKSEDSPVQATRIARGQTFVAPDSFLKLGFKAFSMQSLSPKCKAFLNGLDVVYSEANQRRSVAPAPSLDPADWPVRRPESPVIFMDEQP